jgi:hypothetical protein
MSGKDIQAMLRLSPKEIDLIGLAIGEFGTASQRINWSGWLHSNPVPPKSRESPPLPTDLARMVLEILRSYNKATIARMRNGQHDENETADMGNDLTVTEAVANDLSRELGFGVHSR